MNKIDWFSSSFIHVYFEINYNKIKINLNDVKRNQLECLPTQTWRQRKLTTWKLIMIKFIECFVINVEKFIDMAHMEWFEA